MGKKGDHTAESDPERDPGSAVTNFGAPENQPSPPNYVTCFEFLKLPLKAVWVVLRPGYAQIRQIHEKKQKQTWSCQILEELLKRILPYEYGNNGAIPLSKRYRKRIRKTCCLLFLKFVKNSMPRHFFPRFNIDRKTPEDLFIESHRNQGQEGEEWLYKTSESCSVVAALVATVAFATSTTVPGGSRQDSGTPMFEHQPAFKVFAISSLIAFCFSVMAVITFQVGILPSRYQKKDYGKGLPTKLLVGLTSLFVSIASVLISFCAAHSLMLKNILNDAALPVYLMACLPLMFYAMVQFPFYFDLIWAMFRKLPQRGYKDVPLPLSSGDGW